jgi:hypothetical protein
MGDLMDHLRSAVCHWLIPKGICPRAPPRSPLCHSFFPQGEQSGLAASVPSAHSYRKEVVMKILKGASWLSLVVILCASVVTAQEKLGR